jgi:hypothetical protein
VITVRTRQAPLKVDPDVDQLISHLAHFLGLTKKDLVAEAVAAYRDARREEIRAKIREAAKILDGTDTGRLALLTGLPAERIGLLGGTGE